MKIEDMLKGKKERLLGLVRSNSTPSTIALGLSIGVFIGFLPLYGFHLLIVLLVAMCFPGTNKVAMIAGTGVTMPVTAPFVYWVSYAAGRALTGGKTPPLTIEGIKRISFGDLHSMYSVLFYGCLVLGTITAISVYLAALYSVRAIRKGGTP
ncbi:MAG: DUF2062 domain-containing protein, partial [Candidatus Omnitrophica bacterium]|nr:DUF2062 domain-containing protein [Candidatus Omnitrophota bacterium]